MNANFASQYLKDIYFLFLVVRPALIVFYSTFVTCMDTHKTFVRRRKYVRQKQLDELNFQNAAEIKKSFRRKQRLNSVTSLDDEQIEGKTKGQKLEQDGDLDGILYSSERPDLPEDLAAIYQDSEDEQGDEK